MTFTITPKSELATDRDVQKAERVLGTGREPTEEMIRAQFKQLAKANHPDHGGGGGWNTMEGLQLAKDILIKDLERRNAP